MIDLEECQLCGEQDILIQTKDSSSSAICRNCLEEDYCLDCLDRINEDFGQCINCTGHPFCTKCSGSGEGLVSETRCTVCKGLGVIKTNRFL
jgi:hypothetical protein